MFPASFFIVINSYHLHIFPLFFAAPFILLSCLWRDKDKITGNNFFGLLCFKYHQKCGCMIIFLSFSSSSIHHLIILTCGKPGTAASFGPGGFQTVISGMFQIVHLFLLPIFNYFHFSLRCQSPKHFTISIFPLSHLTFPLSTHQYV